MANHKLFYLKTFLVLSVFALVGGLFLEISFGNPQKSKWHYIFQAYHMKKNINRPKNYTGVWKEWNKSGELMVSTQFKDGILHGEQSVWNLTPNYAYKRQLYKYGKLHGKQEYLQYNGNISSQSFWENGQQNGNHIQYYYDNKIKYKKLYKNNILEGAFICFYEDGTKRIEGDFKNDEPIGDWYFWDKNGKTSKKLNCDNNFEKKEIIKLWVEMEDE